MRRLARRCLVPTQDDTNSINLRLPSSTATATIPSTAWSAKAPRISRIRHRSVRKALAIHRLRLLRMRLRMRMRTGIVSHTEALRVARGGQAMWVVLGRLLLHVGLLLRGHDRGGVVVGHAPAADARACVQGVVVCVNVDAIMCVRERYTRRSERAGWETRMGRCERVVKWARRFPHSRSARRYAEPPISESSLRVYTKYITNACMEKDFVLR